MSSEGRAHRPSYAMETWPAERRPMSCEHAILDVLELRTPSAESLRKRARDVLHNRVQIHKARGELSACFDIIAQARQKLSKDRDARRAWARLSPEKKRAMAKRECLASTELPARIINALEVRGWLYVGEMCLRAAVDFSVLDGFGEKATESIRQMLSARGLAFIGEEAPEPARTAAEALERMGQQCRDEGW